MKKLAFTLAETLIVMGIIGVVAALTLPNLNSSTGDKEKVVKVKKIYQNLQDALGRAEAVYGPVEDWFVNDTTDEQKNKRFGERMTEFMKVSKDCGMAAKQGCFSSTSDYDNDTGSYKVITADGTSVFFKDSSTIYVDIDGPTKGSDTNGKDIFKFKVKDDGVVPNGYDATFANLLKDIKLIKLSAATWIIKYDNADYLKLDSDGKCPNGTTPTETNPRCK